MSKKWEVDASRIILLAKIGRTELLSLCIKEVLVPAAVAKEVRKSGEEDPARRWLDTEGDSLVEFTGSVASTVTAWDLGRGESRVLSYGLRHDG